MKKKLATTLSVVLILGLAVLGILAYLTDSDSDVNVMTLGNVNIEQIEQERDASGNLVDFTQDKPLYPATPGFNENLGEDGLWHKENNAVDKLVSVENTGKSDAYVRTWFAFEQGFLSAEELDAAIGINRNEDNWSWETVATDVVITDDTYGTNVYTIMVATYLGSTTNPTGILAPETVSYPSLLQVCMDSTATNETVEKIDGNTNGTYDILVFSQAIQTAGFENATTALNTEFGKAIVDNHPWAEGVKWPGYVYTVEELSQALEAGGEVKLGTDIVVTPDTELKRGNFIAAIFEDTTLDLNGHDITFDLGADKANTNPRMFYVYYGDLTIKGEGNLSVTNDAAVAWVASGGGNLYIEGGNFISDNHVTGNPNDIFAIIYSSGGEVHVYGGTFTYGNMSGGTNGGFNVQDWWGHKITLYEGVLLSNEVYRQPQDTSALRIRLAEGCELQEVVVDGTTWYKVVKVQ